MSIICDDCGNKFETLPPQCGTTINEVICEKCCVDRNVMKLSKGIERLSLENSEFNEELGEIKKTILQFHLEDSGYKYWVEFGGGGFKCGKGTNNGASIFVDCPQSTVNQILLGQKDPYSEFLAGNIRMKGDLQYAVAYFDFLRLALDINKESGGEWL